MIALLFFFFPSSEEVEEYEIKKGDVTETLSASGRVEAKNRIDMIFQKNGRIENISAVEGQFYEKDQVLITLEKLEEENEVDNRELQLQTAQNNYREIQDEYQGKVLAYEIEKNNLKNAKLAYERNLRLLEIGGVSKK